MLATCINEIMYIAPVMAILTANTSAAYKAKLKELAIICSLVSHCSKMNLVLIIQYKFYTFLACAITAVFDRDCHLASSPGSPSLSLVRNLAHPWPPGHGLQLGTGGHACYATKSKKPGIKSHRDGTKRALFRNR